MNRLFRICPTNKLIIEWKADLLGARWGFYRICDSTNDAKRSLAAINGEIQEDPIEQSAWLEVA